MFQYINYKKASKLFLLFLYFIISSEALGIERSKYEIKIGVFMEDFIQFGEFKKINNSQSGMFPENAKSFHDKKEISQKEFIRTFITQKGLMEKNTHKVILGMGYDSFADAVAAYNAEHGTNYTTETAREALGQ
jgi:hypothetical protein